MVRIVIDLVIGSYCFTDPIFTRESYLRLLNHEVLPMVSDLSENSIFQHNRALSHSSRAVQDLSDEEISDS